MLTNMVLKYNRKCVGSADSSRAWEECEKRPDVFGVGSLWCVYTQPLPDFTEEN